MNEIINNGKEVIRIEAEAIADLIDASSEQAARSAMQSLQGEFSRQIHALVEKVIYLRMYVEAAIDFPDEEIDFLSDGKVSGDLADIRTDLTKIQKQATQGSILREGMKVVIAGRPNAGKSSLLNALAGREAAIVTDIAGTTRDVLREHIHIDGMPLHIIDTAGLREATDKVEQIGIERAWQEILQADRVLFMVDSTTTTAIDPAEIWPDFIAQIPPELGISVIRNKADLTGECQRLTAQYLLQQEQQLRGQIRQWNQAGMEQAQAGNNGQALTLLRQAFVFMPCNAGLVLNLLQTLTQLPADKALKPLAKSAMTALEFSTKSVANQQRLAQLLPQLPELYLD